MKKNNKKRKFANNSNNFQKGKNENVKPKIIKTTTKDALALLSKVRKLGDGEVTYHFEDGATQRTKINSNVFLTESGNNQDLSKVLDVFKSSMVNLGAYRFELHV